MLDKEKSQVGVLDGIYGRPSMILSNIFIYIIALSITEITYLFSVQRTADFK